MNSGVQKHEEAKVCNIKEIRVCGDKKSVEHEGTMKEEKRKEKRKPRMKGGKTGKKKTGQRREGRENRGEYYLRK